MPFRPNALWKNTLCRFAFGVYGAVCIAVAACGGDRFESFEATATEQVIQTSEFPMVVFLALPEGRGLCTGTFVSKRSVLTAAHCTQSPGTYRVFSNFGTFSTSEVVNLSTGQVNDPNDLSMLLFTEDTASWPDGQIAHLGEPARENEKITIVGYGCDDLKTRLGAGRKRMGTNYIYDVGTYLELLTPQTSSAVSARGIQGPINRAGACFGDSGGPMFRMRNGLPEIVGVSHSGGYRGAMIASQYIDLHQTANLRFLDDLANQYGLDITPACGQPGDCTQSAMAGIRGFILLIWNKFLALFL
jgi:hypothetical protein